MKASAVAVLVLLASAASTACVKGTKLCEPHDTLCQSQMGAMNDPACKNGTASNGQCLDPRAP